MSRLESSMVEASPFPHVRGQGAFRSDLCEVLVREFPPVETFTRGRDLPSNFKIQRKAPELLADVGISPAWRKVIAEHASPGVWGDFWRVLGTHVIAEYPRLAEHFSRLKTPKVGLRGRDKASDCDIVLDASLVIHTPVAGRAVGERMPHVKGGKKLFEMHVYLPVEGDSTPGGDFELFAPRTGAPVTFAGRRETSPDKLECRSQMPYRANQFWLLLNTPRSITRLSPREPSPHPIRYFNVLAELPADVYDLPRQAPAAKRRSMWSFFRTRKAVS